MTDHPDQHHLEALVASQPLLLIYSDPGDEQPGASIYQNSYA